MPASHRKAQWRLVCRAEHLEHIKCRVVSARLDIADDLLELLDRRQRNQELVLAESGGPVSAVPFADQIQRVIELREVLDLAAVMAAAPVVQLPDSAESEFVHQPVREYVRNCHQLRCIKFQWVAGEPAWQLVDQCQARSEEHTSELQSQS